MIKTMGQLSLRFILDHGHKSSRNQSFVIRLPLEAALIDAFLFPCEGICVLVVCGDEGINVLLELLEGGE